MPGDDAGGGRTITPRITARDITPPTMARDTMVRDIMAITAAIAAGEVRRGLRAPSLLRGGAHRLRSPRAMRP